jgi:methyltransferase-like protein 6
MLIQKVVLDVGCGVGNTVFPLLEVNPQLFFWAVDFSPRAISLLKVKSSFDFTYTLIKSLSDDVTFWCSLKN